MQVVKTRVHSVCAVGILLIMCKMLPDINGSLFISVDMFKCEKSGHRNRKCPPSLLFLREGQGAIM